MPPVCTDHEPTIRRCNSDGSRVLRGDRPDQSAFDILNKNPRTVILLPPSEHNPASIRQKVRLEPLDEGSGR